MRQEFDDRIGELRGTPKVPVGRGGRSGGMEERGVASTTDVAVTVAITVDGLANASAHVSNGTSWNDLRCYSR